MRILASMLELKSIKKILMEANIMYMRGGAAPVSKEKLYSCVNDYKNARSSSTRERLEICDSNISINR